MSYLEEEHSEWKKQLRKEFISALVGSPSEKTKAFWQIGYYYKCCAPASIYKYFRDDQRSLDTVKENKLWYSAPINFNDVFDSDILIDENGVFDSMLKMPDIPKGIRPGSQVWKAIRNQFRKDLPTLRANLDGLKSTTGIACLTETDDSLLMWSHYANNHRGMCVEYELMAINEQLKFSPVPVVYEDKRVWLRSINQSTLDAELKKVLIESLTSKSPEWSYEREWRIIRDEGACGTKWEKEKNGALLEMVRPSSIVLGCMAKLEFEESVRGYCDKNRISLYKMRKSTEFYKLEKEPIMVFEENM